MKLPRNVNGVDLANKLKKLGYIIIRQTGSHLRLTTLENGEHHITIPAHSPLKLGTLAAILTEISIHFKITKEELVQKLF